MPLPNAPRSIADWCKQIHVCAEVHGWWEEERPFPEIVALIHSEVSEALEEWRDYSMFRQINGESKPEGLSIELADIVIRVMDYCAHAGIDLEDAMRRKHEYNKTRPYRHGGKRA